MSISRSISISALVSSISVVRVHRLNQLNQKCNRYQHRRYRCRRCQYMFTTWTSWMRVLINVDIDTVEISSTCLPLEPAEWDLQSIFISIFLEQAYGELRSMAISISAYCIYRRYQFTLAPWTSWRRTRVSRGGPLTNNVLSVVFGFDLARLYHTKCGIIIRIWNVFYFLAGCVLYRGTRAPIQV